MFWWIDLDKVFLYLSTSNLEINFYSIKIYIEIA